MFYNQEFACQNEKNMPGDHQVLKTGEIYTSVNHFCDNVREYASFRAAVQSGSESLRAKDTIVQPAKPHLNAVSLAGR